jgi:hypothetical protein
MNLCNVRNRIQLSDQVIHDVIDLFPRQDVWDSNFQDAIIQILCLGKCFKLLIQRTNDKGEHYEVPEKLIPTFSGENESLGSDNMGIIKCHYTKCYIQIRRLDDARFVDWVYSLYKIQAEWI